MDWKNFASSPKKHTPRPYINTLVRFHHIFSLRQREEIAKAIGWNVFDFPSQMLLGGDLLTDSGTTTLTSEQFAQMILGDTAYGTNYGYPLLLDALEKFFGVSMDTSALYLTHQGRAAENLLFSSLREVTRKNRRKLIIPSNGHFDTTAANIEAAGMRPLNLFSEDFLQGKEISFTGNMDVERLKKLLEERGENVLMVYMTITNNTAGGQPASLKNIKEVSTLCKKHDKAFFLDVCRFAENALFISQFEEEYRRISIPDIVREIFSQCDGFTTSFKKDGLANTGGGLLIKKNSPLVEKYPQLLDTIRSLQTRIEGNKTSGGIQGRDQMIIAEGLKTAVTKEYLKYRIALVEAFGALLYEYGIPVIKPFGGHAVYIDVDRFFDGTKMRREDFGGIALTGLLLLSGVRLCELGAFAFGKYNPKTGKEVFQEKNLVRCALPRNKYEINDLAYVARCVKKMHDMRDVIPRAVPVYGRDLALRHFEAKFELVSR